MKKLAGSMVFAACVTGRLAEAQAPLSRIAYDVCPEGWGNSGCLVRIADADGPGGAEIGAGFNPSWSPDGMKLAYSQEDGEGGASIVVLDLRDWTLTSVTGGYYYMVDSEPAWSPDGTRIAFSRFDVYGQSYPGIHVVNTDGSGLTWLSGGSAPTWSPDGARIAFGCPATTGVGAICAMDATEGATVSQLTDGSANASSPAFAADGRILFQTDDSLSVMNADGTGIAVLYSGWPADRLSPKWSPDASRIAYWMDPSCDPGYPCESDFVGIVNADGTGDRLLALGRNPSWTQTTQPVPPIASFSVACTDGACAFDASASWDADGTIAEYTWTFGDGATATGPQVSHVYAHGTYAAALTVRDAGGLTGTRTQTIFYPAPPPPMPPIAQFSFSCNETACSFSGYGSYDPDGSIVSYAWSFGDGTVATGMAPSHTYAGPGTYAATLTVTDDDGLSNAQTRNVLVQASRSHIGDLDRAVTNQGGNWTAHVTLTAHDTFEGRVAGAVVTGFWPSHWASCTTNAAGQCTVTRTMPRSIRSTTFTINEVSSPLIYTWTSNHDPDGDSDGTSITVTR